MKCQVCQSDLSAGATFCTNCGTPVPSNPYGSPASPSSPNQGIAPTMMASSTPPDPYGQPPSTPYGQTPSSPYDQPPASPYNAPPANPYGMPATSYGADVPPANPYNVPPANPYGTPPPPAFDPNAGAYGVPGAYGQPLYAPPQKKKGPNGCVIALIIVAVIFVLGVSGIIALGVIGANAAKGIINNANATLTADAGTVNAFDTPTTGTTGGVPSAGQIDPTAVANLNHVKTSSAVDAHYKPTHVTSSFTTSDTVYLTYDLAGKAGYVSEKTYDASGTVVFESTTPHVIDKGDTNGYISLSGSDPGSFTTGLYWCQQSDCSDAALAAVVNFTVA